MKNNATPIAKRFRGFLPVIVDVETGGLNYNKDALLEIAAVTVDFNEEGLLTRTKTYHFHVQPFEGANMDQEALELNKIDPGHPFRFAIPEKEALEELFKIVNEAVKQARCQRAVLVGHNAWFDLFFLKAAIERCKIKKSPFHAFTTLDTATLGAAAYGQTVLARAAKAADIPFDRNEAHSAIYDAEATADLFCKIINTWPTT